MKEAAREEAVSRTIHEWLGKCWSDDYEYRPTKFSLGGQYLACKACGKEEDDHSQPDYENDLNEIRVAELKAIEEFGFIKYAEAVISTVDPTAEFDECDVIGNEAWSTYALMDIVLAPASVRASAICRLLEGR